MPAKILFYTHGLVDGGGERLWACLASAFKARGYDVIFAQDFEAEDNRGNLDPTIPVFTLGRNHLASIRALANVLAEQRPDVALSAIGGSGLKLLLAKALARGAATKTVITYHGFREWKTGWLSLASYAGLPLMSSYADAVVAVADGLRTDLVERWKSRDDKTVTILNPVFFPANLPLPSRAALSSRPQTILAVGRLAPEKDYLTLLRAFALIGRREARLVIVGKGPEEDRIKAEIDRLGLKLRVTLAGYSKDPWRHYMDARCLALSSTSEVFGNVIVEALAFGLPVVATDCPGPRQILDGGRYGRLVPVGDAHALSYALRDALDDAGDPAPRRERADAFSFEARVPAYEALVEKLIAAPVSSPAPAAVLKSVSSGAAR